MVVVVVVVVVVVMGAVAAAADIFRIYVPSPSPCFFRGRAAEGGQRWG